MELEKLRSVLRKVNKANFPATQVKKWANEANLKMLEPYVWPNFSGTSLTNYMNTKEGQAALKMNQRHPAFI